MEGKASELRPKQFKAGLFIWYLVGLTYVPVWLSIRNAFCIVFACKIEINWTVSPNTKLKQRLIDTKLLKRAYIYTIIAHYMHI